MGSGKTTLGKKLALSMNCPFLDVDAEIEKSKGTPISQIFAEEGEEQFRKLEKEFIDGLKKDDLQIVSVGGGLPCFNDMIDSLLKIGIVVYLKTSKSTLFERLNNDLNERPLIEGMGESQLKIFIAELLSEREKYYLQAHVIVSEQDQTIEKITQLILPLQKS